MINDSESVNEILDKINKGSSSTPSSIKQLNFRKKKVSTKYQFSSIAKFAIIMQQIFLLFGCLYLTIQKVIYRIPMECYLIYNHSLCKVFLTGIYVIVLLRIIRNLLKLYKKKEKQYKYLFHSNLFNCDVTLQTFRYYMGIKCYIILLFIIQFMIENYLAITVTQIWSNQISENSGAYFMITILMQIVICDITYEYFMIFSGRYGIADSRHNSIVINKQNLFDAICKFKLLIYCYKFYKETKWNYKIYTRSKGIPLF
ncbi:unnamed protein product [Paramecium sonneborni]|uniref:Uncharacterized protein n=1 Tax=Paramecium sonneborni TaxID=65129 RepID=A0A8S1QU53_9CILI|nr:unnamed protein product [Paramecium sonneborni]